MLYTLITILVFITCILLILIVLVQNSKGGGLASNFQASNQIMGVRKTADFLEKATWALAGTLLFLSIVGTAFIPRDNKAGGSILKDKIENVVDPNQVPSFPAPTATQTTTPTTTQTTTPAATDTTK